MNGIIETIVNSLKDLLGLAVKAIPGLLGAIIILFLTRYAVQLVQNIVDNAGSRAIRSLSLRLLLKKTTRVAIWVIGIVLACVVAFPDFELGDVIATLGLGSVAIGFAFQDIFKNFLAGIILLIEEPFSIGDEIHTGDFEGKVENISIRTTQIRTYQGQKVLLPNSTVFTEALEVVTAYPSRRTDLAVGVDYNTPLTEASNILESLIARVEGVLDNPAPEIDLVNFNDSSIDFIVRYWTKPQQKEVRHVQTRAIVAIKKAFDDADINIPYPIRTLYYYDQEKYNDYFPNENRSSNS
ncbi:mechanosensitive ion channel family protein [Myxosarcina sp. GI1]|uniref:mechanosensitive ion channel family protein n=1 Tax=Myxosarcina sp. GI1 TaxID=1541065 RepID=UPI00055DFDCA|nr:mechanosensitive ion channel family protein [Myxosarcina sp. GI1]